MMTIETDPGWPTTMPLTVRHSQVVTSDDTEHSLHESVTCHKTVQTSSSHRCGYVVRWQNHRCGTWNASRELAGTSSASQERSVGSAGNRVVTWRGQLGCCLGRRQSHSTVGLSWSHLEGKPCLKVRTRKQQVVALSSADSELNAAVNTASEGIGIQSVARDLGISFD